MKKLLFVLAILSYTQFSSAQEFRLYPEMQLTSLAQNEGELTLNNGDIVTGDIALATVQTSSGLQRINSVRVFGKGKKQKYKPKDIKEIRIKANWSDQTRGDALNDNSLQIKFYSDIKSDYYIFRSVSDKKGKTRLMQLLNPGFDDNIQVYVDAKAKESSFAAMVGKDSAKSYYLTKDVNSKKGIYVKKSKYKKQFSNVFGDCKSIMSEFGGKVKWGDFTKHIYHYDQNCE